MPLPWSDESAIIPQVEYRAISIEQLRDVEIFVQRLCKTGLLRDESNERVTWFNVNMYQIVNLLIKPAITYVQGQRGKGPMYRYSWVEFVAQKKQRPTLLFSHSWSGRFRDFMQVVEAVVHDNGFSANVAIWVCTFANSQFGEDFGSGLRDSPFYKAIKAAEQGTVLVVDRAASSLQRIWCALEVYLTTKEMQHKKLRVYTSMGQVGKTVTSGILVDEVEKWDIRRMEATQDSDRRQILNYLCRGPEHEKDGLQLDDDGEFKLDGWKKLLDGDETTDARQRLHGKPEYTHEHQLFEECQERIDGLNEEVQGVVKKAARLKMAVQPTGCQIEKIEDRGVTLGEIRRFDKRLREQAEAQEDYHGMVVDDVFHKRLSNVELTNGQPWSYAEVMSSEDARSERRPRFVIQQNSDHNFSEVISAIEWFAEAARLPDSTVFHFSPLCRNWHNQEEHSYNDDAMKTLLMNCDGMLSVLAEEPGMVVRANRMRALQYCFETAKNIYLGCATGVLACTTAFPSGRWVFGHFSPRIGKLLQFADWNSVDGDDRTQKLCVELVKRAPGGIEGFKNRMARVAAGSVLREAARTNDTEAVHKICRIPGLTMSAAFLRGALGESPAHIAAGMGHLEVLRILLDASADPNAEDHLRETPMHYAAMAGHVKAVRLLLKYGATCNAESAFAETPLMVAEQNPAGFLNVTTCRVVALLRSWDSAAEDAKDENPYIHKVGSPCCGSNVARLRIEKADCERVAMTLKDKGMEGNAATATLFLTVMGKLGLPKEEILKALFEESVYADVLALEDASPRRHSHRSQDQDTQLLDDAAGAEGQVGQEVSAADETRTKTPAPEDAAQDTDVP